MSALQNIFKLKLYCFRYFSVSISHRFQEPNYFCANIKHVYVPRCLYFITFVCYKLLVYKPCVP